MVKVERSFPAPPSLVREARKKSGSYKCPDVIEQLEKDFHNKCYLCEISPVQDPEVEHLLPHEGGKYRDRMFDWENLFWSCGHCNSIKNNAAYRNGILNCCKTDPEEHIRFELLDGNVVITARNETEPLIGITVQLLDEVYNKKNTGMRTVASQVRMDELCLEMDTLFQMLDRYHKNRTDKVTLRTLRGLLNRSQCFAAFKREYVRAHESMYPELIAMLATEEKGTTPKD